MTVPTAPPAGGEWTLFGYASVDSGTLAVIDPCYVIDKGEEIYGLNEWDEDYKVKPYSSYCDKLGVQFFSGFGDGTYEVWGYVVDFGPGGFGGRRVCEVRVVMVAEDEW